MGSFPLLSDVPEHYSQNTGPQMADQCLLPSLKAPWARLCLPRSVLFSLAHGVTSALCCSFGSHSFQALYTSPAHPLRLPTRCFISFSLCLDHSSLSFHVPKPMHPLRHVKSHPIHKASGYTPSATSCVSSQLPVSFVGAYDTCHCVALPAATSPLRQ